MQQAKNILIQKESAYSKKQIANMTNAVHYPLPVKFAFR